MLPAARSPNGTPLFNCVCPSCGASRLGDRRRLGLRCKKCTLLERNTSHGMRYSPLYRLWASMRARCTYPSLENYKYYGGRGIRVCPEWHSFPVFQEWALCAGYEEGAEIDRLDNDGNYEAGNCRFVTHQINSQKRTNSVCNLAKARMAKDLLGAGLTVKKVSEHLELPYMAVWHISKGNTWRNA